MGLLDQGFGDRQPPNQGGMSPITLALLGLLAYRAYEGKGRLAEMLGRAGATSSNPAGGRAGGESRAVNGA